MTRKHKDENQIKGTPVQVDQVSPELLKHLAKRQHYVPQCLLRRFAIPNTSGEPRIYFYDKILDRVGASSIHDTASKNGFYNFKEKGETFTLEIGLEKIERRADMIIESIVRARSVGHLTTQNRVNLADYMIKQLVRTPKARAETKAMFEALGKALEGRGVPLRDIFPDYEPLTDKHINLLAIDQLRDGGLSPKMLLDKAWMLLETTASAPFLTSDHPVVRMNCRAIRENWPRGSRGLRSPYVEISFPLSPTLCLSLVSKEHVAEIGFAYVQIIERERRFPKQAFALWEPKILCESLMEGMMSGNAHPINPDAVLNLNSAQCFDSLRQVYSFIPEFSLPRQMRIDGCFKDELGGKWVWK